jgi:hypothetical protein
MRTSATKQAFSQFETLCKELDTLVLGLGVDADTNSIYLDFDMTALAGTNTAKRFASAKDAKTDFAGFLIPSAAMTVISSSTNDDAEVAQGKQMIDTIHAMAVKALDANEDLSKEKRDSAKQLIADATDVLKRTLDTKKSDSGMALLLDGAPTLVAGAALADGAKLEKDLKEFVAGEPELDKLVKFDADEHQGVKFHVATVPISDEQAAAVFGKEVKVVVGFGQNVVYIGAGKDPLKPLKQAIDDSKKSPGKSVPTTQITLTGAPIATFIAQVASEADVKAKAAKIAKVLAKSSGRDHITVTVKATDNGASMRLCVEEGIAKALGAASAAQ